MAQLYRFDGWVKTVQGQAVAGAQVYICAPQPTDTAWVPPLPQASVFADPLGFVPITQPIYTDGFGHYDAYAASGIPYTIVVVNNGTVQAVYPDQVPEGAILGASFTGTVTNDEGPLAAGALILGNGGNDVISGAVLTGNPLEFLNGMGVFAVPAGGGTGTVTSVAAGTGLTATPSPITASGSLAITNTAVIPGSYTNTNLTVNAQGQITAAANGSGGGGSTFPFIVVQEQWFQSGGSDETSYTLTFPQATAASGNTVFILVAADGSSPFPTPSGWTIDFDQQENTYARLVLLHKTTAADTTIVFTNGSPSSWAGVMFELVGAHALDQSSTGGTGNTNTVILPPITPTANSLVFGAAGIVTNGAVPYPLIQIGLAQYTPNGSIATPNGGRGLISLISTQAAANVATTPPPLVFPNVVLFNSGGVAYATFSIL